MGWLQVVEGGREELVISSWCVLMHRLISELRRQVPATPGLAARVAVRAAVTGYTGTRCQCLCPDAYSYLYSTADQLIIRSDPDLLQSQCL